MTTVDAILSYIGDVATFLATQVGQWVEVIASQPLLIFVVVLGFATIGIGLLSRLYRSFR